jgi:ribosomal 30S subunit maturation factor RimM
VVAPDQTVELGILLPEGERERLLPFIETVVRQVDVAGGSITVDWEADY